MAEVAVIIFNLNKIASATYQSPTGHASSRPTGLEQAFNSLKDAAGDVARTLTADPRPNRDKSENIANSFAAMKKSLESYAKANPAGAQDVFTAFNIAEGEWKAWLREQ
jgi:hypothetical protein